MFKFISKVLVFFSLVFSLHADDGLLQEHLVSLSPEASAIEVALDGSIEVQYDLAIVSKSVKNKTITLRDEDNKKVQGTTTLKNETTLLFTPAELLNIGTYKVKVKILKLQDFTVPTSGYKKYAYKACEYLYDDVKDCPLCKYLCSIKTKKIVFSFSADDSKPKVINLALSQQNLELNIDNQTDINVTATYDDNSTVDVTSDVEWNMSNDSVVSVTNNTINPTNEGTTTLSAKFNNQESAQIQITVYKEINGYKLPPEPDETLNNSTLLGIDSNDNGVRDDVERLIVQKYKDKHVIVREIGLQGAKAYQQIIDNPLDTEANHKALHDAMDCSHYFKFTAKYAKLGDPVLIDHYVSTTYKNLQLNTKSRLKAYIEYDKQLSGGVFTSTKLGLEERKNCSFDVESLLGTK